MGLIPPGTDEILVLAVVASLVIAGFTKGAIGVGMPIIAMPLLTWLIGLQDAVILLTLPLILSNIPQSLEGGKTLAATWRLWPVVAGMIPGILLGVYLLVHTSMPVATLCAAVALIAVGSVMLASARVVIPSEYHRSAGIVSGFFGGVLGGLAALPGPVVFIYMIGKGLHGKDFTKEASLFLVISSGLLALALSSTGVFSMNDWSLSLAALAPVLFGMYLGRNLRDRLNAEIVPTHHPCGRHRVRLRAR